jgi:hypothetical protein
MTMNYQGSFSHMFLVNVNNSKLLDDELVQTNVHIAYIVSYLDSELHV